MFTNFCQNIINLGKTNANNTNQQQTGKRRRYQNQGRTHPCTMLIWSTNKTWTGQE